MARVTWLNDALHDLDAIAAYVEQLDPEAAMRIRLALVDCGKSLATFPRRGRPARGGLREIVTVPPYILTYRVTLDEVSIVEVRHGAKLPREQA